MEQRHSDHRGQHGTGQLIDHHGREVARRAIRPGVKRGDAGHPLDQVVVRRELLHGAAFTEAARACVDQLRIARGQGRVIQPQSVRRADPHIVDEDVRGFDQTQDRLVRRGLFQIQCDTAFVAVEIGIVAAHTRRAGGPKQAGRIALCGFDLDYIGAHIAQCLRAVWTEHDRSDVDDADAGERAGGCCHRGVLIVKPISLFFTCLDVRFRARMPRSHEASLPAR